MGFLDNVGNLITKVQGGAKEANSSGDKSEQLVVCALYPIKSDGTIIKNDLGRFLINPTSWEESKPSNWSTQQVPGQSSPILQWTSGGSRKISFDALITKDISSSDTIDTIKTTEEKLNFDGILNAVGKIASSFFKITVPPLRNTPDTSSKKQFLDISFNLNYYRSLLYPVYSKSGLGRLESSPPLIALFSGNTFTKDPHGDKINTDSEVWVVTNLRIRITKQLPNLSPMEAVVSFELTEYNIKSFGRDKFTKAY